MCVCGVRGMIKIVGLNNGSSGRSCEQHGICGQSVEIGMLVTIAEETISYGVPCTL